METYGNQSVTAGIAETAKRLQAVCAGIEKTLRVLAAARQGSWLARGVNPIRQVANVALVLSSRDVLRETRLQRHNRAQLPTAEDCSDWTAMIEKGLPLAERQFVQQRCDEAMVVAETGDRAFASDAKFVL